MVKFLQPFLYHFLSSPFPSMAPPSDTYFAEPGLNITGNVSEFGSPDSEKQISIDPFSLRELPKIAVASPTTIGGLMHLPASLLPGKPKFLSCSLPNSAHSSPRLNPSFLKKIRVSPLQHQSSSPTAEEDQQQEEQPNLPLEFYLRRSKSCAEGRSLAPSVDFDLWLDKPGVLKPYPPTTASGKVNKKSNAIVTAVNYDADVGSDEGFKCGALCLFLPGFGKAKTVRSSSRKEGFETANAAMISRTVSLEKFECGSWASSAIGAGEGDFTNNYFDLPMELIRSGANDANSPVSAAFLFDKDVKGVLKNGSSSSRSMTRGSAAARKSHESGRHVRFSTASPVSYPASPASCVTPRLRKAREDFNAFLEAQSA